MPAIARSPQSRPPGSPAYYLARPASWWLRREPTRRRTGQPSSRYLGYE